MPTATAADKVSGSVIERDQERSVSNSQTGSSGPAPRVHFSFLKGISCRGRPGRSCGHVGDAVVAGPARAAINNSACTKGGHYFVERAALEALEQQLASVAVEMLRDGSLSPSPWLGHGQCAIQPRPLLRPLRARAILSASLIGCHPPLRQPVAPLQPCELPLVRRYRRSRLRRPRGHRGRFPRRLCRR
jgi:hypothetical protein